MNQFAAVLLERSIAGHLAITQMHAGDTNAIVERMVVIQEKENRGVRFLPRQVIKRAVRNFKLSGSKDKT